MNPELLQSIESLQRHAYGEARWELIYQPLLVVFCISSILALLFTILAFSLRHRIKDKLLDLISEIITRAEYNHSKQGIQNPGKLRSNTEIGALEKWRIKYGNAE